MGLIGSGMCPLGVTWSKPPAEHRVSRIARPGVLLSLVRAPALPPQHADFGSQFHTPSNRCLRFGPRVTATPARLAPVLPARLSTDQTFTWQAHSSFSSRTPHPALPDEHPHAVFFACDAHRQLLNIIGVDRFPNLHVLRTRSASVLNWESPSLRRSYPVSAVLNLSAPHSARPSSLAASGYDPVIPDLDHALGLPVLRALSFMCTCCRQYPGAATGRRLRSSRPAVSAFPEVAVRSACTSTFSELARRSLELRPAHSRRPLYVTSYTEGFSHFVTSMTAPVASGWAIWPGGACTHWKAPPSHGARKWRPFETARQTGQIPGKENPDRSANRASCAAITIKTVWSRAPAGKPGQLARRR